MDIRIFPKYDDAEIIKVGNPALKPQYSNRLELGYKTTWNKGYFYASVFQNFVNNTITRISSTVDSSKLIYNIFQNAGNSNNTGLELIFNQKLSKWYSFTLNATAYHNTISAFTVENLYPYPNTYSAAKQQVYSGNVKWNSFFTLPKKFEAQVTMTYLAPDIFPQGKIGSQFWVDFGLKKSFKDQKSSLFVNANDIFNTLKIKKTIYGSNFSYNSIDYKETQVVRVGYNYKF